MQQDLSPFFPAFSKNLHAELIASGQFRHFEEDLEILSPGAEVGWIPLVIKGSIRVLRDDPSGKEILLYHIQAGESCVMSILAGLKTQPSQIRAVANAGSEVWLFPSRRLKFWQQEFRDWNQFVLELYQTRFEELVQVVNELAFSRVDERLLELLRTRTRLEKNLQISTTHQQLADELGTAREVVSRLLKKLEQEGWVKLGRGKLELLKES
ncbi:Crp/Fnr family transcriptional regulator [bacterium (Candidatus Blackallbacteria) CG17_big_fil_post_rev_8_21_14_2_50_48_46]|uniref:Crp/Fnr family transcriptional regulator n=1 Tax=bacterium (Candidatus Blackallbacteria) CG17_big_fil_post_rev_8_21_14_2_50_48_46 TaxID=2014261 RepID=A0A2M7G1W5_9BACT|nr:MAG: Crp/Fnr family transcriptional regulator [bacterium (Candidatus Blackallbacteria) CG18_big_fil_WC_8_21_14_2_50_49_26]PIW15736.1 MAG: Crp/Fnr family transcriptional regulator [bacterium (Candidatus Blackallbacteria) CG17_big_fil_post_rev_8_21_14_2_50_48_46]PIW49238.1 MAG: Crp/Fnr family transcriptional regulator [bacterium (Candidatus Blackallbacteria) CG13_big_fil_rev_8_21_14_2_50_49_14]